MAWYLVKAQGQLYLLPLSDECSISGSVVGLSRQNPHLLNPIISSSYAVKFMRRILDKILYVLCNRDIPAQLLQSVLSQFLQIGTITEVA